MDLNVFLILILSHIVFDFVFQGNKILKLRFPERIEEAKSNTIKGNLIHSLIHFIGVYAIALLFFLISGQAIFISFWVILLITIFHFIIDEIKSSLYIKNTSAINNIWLFLFDQLSHLLVILGVLKFVEKVDVINIFREKLVNNNFLAIEKYLLVLIFVFVATWVTGIFIKILLGHLSKRSNLKLNNYIEEREFSEDENKTEVASNENNIKEELNSSDIKSMSDENKINVEQNLKENEENSTKEDLKSESETSKDNNSLNVSNSKKEELDEGAPNGGFIIGILERIFIVISIVINYPMMIGFVLTVKSVARFKKLSNDSFAEYFIIGTFLSFIPAILIGLIIKWLII